MSERLLDLDEAAELLNVPRSWVAREARCDRIPHCRLGRYYRFDAQALHDWAARRQRGPVESPRGAAQGLR